MLLPSLRTDAPFAREVPQLADAVEHWDYKLRLATKGIDEPSWWQKLKNWFKTDF
jgi:hypothetical protein